MIEASPQPFVQLVPTKKVVKSKLAKSGYTPCKHDIVKTFDKIPLKNSQLNAKIPRKDVGTTSNEKITDETPQQKRSFQSMGKTF